MKKPDLIYKITDDGWFASFLPETPAGEQAWNEMAAATEATSKVLVLHLEATLAQLRQAGYIVHQHRGDGLKISTDELLAALEADYGSENI